MDEPRRDALASLIVDGYLEQLGGWTGDVRARIVATRDDGQEVPAEGEEPEGWIRSTFEVRLDGLDLR